VTGQPGAEEILRRLAAENLFLTTLDDQGQWYRYHPLFAEALRAQLDDETRRECHRRAARWYAGEQLMQDAIRNALAAEDYQLMAALLTRTYKDFLARGLLVSLQQWLSALPAEQTSPRLRLAVAWCRVYESNEQELQAIIAQIEPSLTAADEPFRGEMRAVQAVYASLYGDGQRSVPLATEALALAAPDDYLSRAAAYHGMGNAYRARGELDAALAAYGQARQQFAVMGHVFMSQLPLYRSAHLLILQGRLHQALETYESVLRLAEEAGEEPIVLSGEIFGYLSELYCEWNDLEQAAAYARREIELAQTGNMRLALVDGYLKLAVVAGAQGKTSAAREALSGAAAIAARLQAAPLVAQVALSQARLDLDTGNLAAAGRWADDYAGRRGTSACVLAPLVVPSADLLLARIRLAQGHTTLALDLLEEIMHSAGTGGRTRLLVEALLLQALAWHRQKQEAASRKALVRALALGKEEDYVRVFIENGPVLGPLLQQVRHLFPGYVSRLLAALQPGETAEAAGTVPLREPLTAREQEILALIAQGYANREIAETLVLSVGTVKGHVNHIFGKLNVRSRTQALLRAAELNLLDT
jgi:LuxR family maltose regulon positive regulatory protein